MPDEFDGYRDTVLDAARRSDNVPPQDLFVRYHLDPNHVRDEAEFGRRVELVVKYWRKLKLQRKYQQLATALLAADSDLRRRRQLTYEFFTQQRGSARDAAQSRFDSLVAAIAASTPCITLATLQRLVSTLSGAFTEQEVRTALEKHNVAVVDPVWETVDIPIGTSRSLSTPLTALGLRLSAEVVFGEPAVRAGFTLRNGFQLADGRTLTMDALHKLRDEHSRSKHDERKTAVDNVLTILIKAADENCLEQLLLWEVQQQLRPDVAAGLPVRAIVRTAQELGLAADDAAALAATLASAKETRRDDGLAARAASALKAGELLEAAALLAQLPETEATEIRAHLAGTRRQVEELVRAADQALTEARSEDAAGLFADAMQIARDDETLPARLAAIAPPAPADVSISRQFGKVAMRWTPSAARVPGVRYVVVRAVGEPAVSIGGGTRVGETEANEIVDSEPDAVEPNYYSVFAARAEGVWSAGRSAGPVELVPEVSGVELKAASGIVNGSWTAHPAVAEVVITRTDRADPDATPYPVRVNGPSAFTDDDVQNGHTYDYSFRAVYLTRTGQRRTSDPVVVPATPMRPPGSVRHMDHEVLPGRDGTNLRLIWQQPTIGTVEIRVSAEPPDWEVDTLVERATAHGFGQPASGEVTVDGNTASLTVPAPQGRVALTAFVLAGDQARVGASITLALADAVTGLRAERFDDQVRLRWVWPPGANLARISWHSPEAGSESRDQTEITRRVYGDGGGVRIDVAPGAVTVSVVTVIRDRGEEHLSAAMTVLVPGEPARVTFGVRMSGLFTRRRQDLVLTADRPCRLPGLLVVHRADGIVPLRPESGRVVAKVEPCDLEPGSAATVPLSDRVQPLSGLACFVAPDSPPADEVTLVPAPVG